MIAHKKLKLVETSHINQKHEQIVFSTMICFHIITLSYIHTIKLLKSLLQFEG